MGKASKIDSRATNTPKWYPSLPKSGHPHPRLSALTFPPPGSPHRYGHSFPHTSHASPSRSMSTTTQTANPIPKNIYTGTALSHILERIPQALSLEDARGFISRTLGRFYSIAFARREHGVYWIAVRSKGGGREIVSKGADLGGVVRRLLIAA